MSLQCQEVSTSIIVGLPIIWWCFWNEPCRRPGSYWGRLENILNSAAWSSQWRHSPSYHDHNIVHLSGCCESSDWLSGCLCCRAGRGCGHCCSARRGCNLFTLAFLSLAKQRIGSKKLICALNASIHLFWFGPGVSMPIADLPSALTYVGFNAIRMSRMSHVFTRTPFPDWLLCASLANQL